MFSVIVLSIASAVVIASSSRLDEWRLERSYQYVASADSISFDQDADLSFPLRLRTASELRGMLNVLLIASKQTSGNRLVHAAAVLGVLGGVLRAAGSFAPTLIASDAMQTWFYIVIDVCLAAGLFSIYLPRRRRMSVTGSIGFFLALAGLITNNIGPAVTHVNLYPIAAPAIAVGVLTLTLSEWHARRMATWIPVTFELSVVLGGIGMFVPGAGTLFIVSGVLFGTAFAGMATVRDLAKPSDVR
jgi:hypothetical protein